jgi:hypothetical protein
MNLRRGTLETDPAPVLGSPVTPDVNAASSCTYGTATGLGCPSAHWERFTTVHAYMYLEDHTGTAWPVYASQIEWNKSCCVGAYYAGTQCKSSFHCVKVTEGHFGATGWVRLTTYTVDSNHHFISVKIQYSDSYSMTAAQHRQTTCHEQGHALGLGHNGSTASCLYYAILSSAPKYPTSDDFNMLKYRIYNH